MAGTPKRRARKIDELEAAVLAVAATVAKLIPASYVRSADGRDLVPSDFEEGDIGRWWNELLLYTECASTAVEIVADETRRKASLPDPQPAKTAASPSESSAAGVGEGEDTYEQAPASSC